MIELLKVYEVTYAKLRICIYSYILPCAVRPAVSSSTSKMCYKNIIVQLLVKCVTAANVANVLHLHTPLEVSCTRSLIQINNNTGIIRPSNYEGKSRKVNGQWLSSKSRIKLRSRL